MTCGRAVLSSWVRLLSAVLLMESAGAIKAKLTVESFVIYEAPWVVRLLS